MDDQWLPNRLIIRICHAEDTDTNDEGSAYHNSHTFAYEIITLFSFVVDTRWPWQLTVCLIRRSPKGQYSELWSKFFCEYESKLLYLSGNGRNIFAHRTDGRWAEEYLSVERKIQNIFIS